MLTTKIPSQGEYPKFYKPYIDALDDDDLLVNLVRIHDRSQEIFSAYPEEKWEYRYDKGKWHLKEVLGHLMDAERIFSTRALRFARNDTSPLPGFEQNQYVPESNVTHRTVPDLLEEWGFLRKATTSMFKNFSQEMLQREGVASDWPISVMAIGFVIAGHERHHQNVFLERYF